MDLFSDLNPKVEPSAATPQMISGSNGMILCGILIILVIIFAFYIYNRQRAVAEQKCSDRFNKNVILYMSDTCPYCIKQVELLNQFGVTDKITVCNLSNAQCDQDFKSTGIQGVPAFVMSGKPLVNSVGFRDDLCVIADQLGLKK
jgi:glutaredoxin